MQEARYSKSRTRPSKVLHEKHLSPWNKIFMSWLAGTLAAKSDDLAYAIRLVRSKSKSKVLHPCVFWDFYFGLSVKKVIQRSRVRKVNHISQKRKQKRWLKHVYMRPEVNSNRFEISLRGKISLRWNFKPQWVFHVNSKCLQWNKVAQNH